MAQHDYVIANGTGAAVRSDLNSALAAIVSQNSGATAPSPTYAFQLWADTTTNLLKLRNSANSAWLTVGDITATNLGLATAANPVFTGVTMIPLGSASAPSLTFSGDTNTGVYSPGADQVAVTTGGTGRLFIDSSGRVGIGTSSPARTVHIANSSGDGALAVDGGSAAAAYIDFRIAGTNKHYIGSANVLGGSGTSNDMTVWNSTNGYMSFGTNFTERLRITSAGNVGIGTASPGALLHVQGTGNPVLLESTNDAYALGIKGTGTTSTAYLGCTSTNALNFYVSGAERARIDSAGRWLLGTSSTRSVGGGSRRFEIEEVSSTYGESIVRNANDTQGALLALGKSRGSSVLSNTVVNSGDTLGGLEFYGADGSTLIPGASLYAQVDATPGTNDMPGRLVFSTTADGASSPTERMRISNGGYTSFNTTSVIGSARVSIAQDFNAANGLGIQNTGAQGGGQYFALFYNSAGTLSGTIAHNGTATVAFNTSSDYRLKENIAPISDGITRLRQLIPSRFNFIDEPDKTVDGFIAHEVQEVIPEAVTGEKDAVNEDGSIHPQGIDQSKLVPLLTAALQEAIGEIESLKARVAALESA